MDILSETKFLMKKYNISANKSLGQNFLVDEEIILNTIKYANINKNDLVLEIGPGLRNTYKQTSRKCWKSYLYRT